MQLAAAILLAAFYLGLSLAVGGLPTRGGFIWWFFVPLTVTFCGHLLADRVSTVLPVPWDKGAGAAAPPRSVHLSWRTALRVPASLPAALVPCYFLMVLRLHFAIGWALILAAALVLAALAFVARKRLRELRLLRHGRVAMAEVDSRSLGDWPDEICYHFVAEDGTPVSGRGNDLGYGLAAGSAVPVYYDAGNPQRHVVATACWFEAE